MIRQFFYLHPVYSRRSPIALHTFQRYIQVLSAEDLLPQPFFVLSHFYLHSIR
jgi:hypothetical protein